jgi:hypothetical protein
MDRETTPWPDSIRPPIRSPGTRSTQKGVDAHGSGPWAEGPRVKPGQGVETQASPLQRLFFDTDPQVNNE